MRLHLLILALVLVGCETRGMGETCSSSRACMSDGVCLKGVCTGYHCDDDADCDDDMVCGSVLDVRSCMFTCQADDDCQGEQGCVEVSTGTSGDHTALYCM